MPDASSENLATDYINSTSYKTLVQKVRNLRDVCFDLTAKTLASRKLRYCEIDIETERKAGRLAPDDVYVPIHLIDMNIRREQSSYIQYITQSPRMVILKDKDDPSFDLSLLEVDLTEKLRFDGWQLGMYANIDGFQANGYGIMETVLDMNNPGELGREYVQYGDFGFIADSRDIQKCEMVGRSYYFTKTKLKDLRDQEGDGKWSKEQVDKLLNSEPNDEQSQVYSGTTTINRSLFKIIKVMFRVKGVVYVAWACPIICDDWLRAPRKLFLGRRKLNDEANKLYSQVSQVPPAQQQAVIVQLKKSFPDITDKHIEQLKSGIPASDEQYETQYPYFLYPYLISENDTIANLKGRVFLDQDSQTAATNLMSSTVTKARRSSYLMFGKDSSDPNDDFLMQKNIIGKPGALINGKVKEFELSAPDPALFNSINVITSMNQQETSQVNFAEQNRQQDSRKTATAIKAATAQAQQLSTVQVTLFSTALKMQLSYECDIIRSRVMTGLIKVSDTVAAMYARKWTVKPSGDVDVIEKAQMIQSMLQLWGIVQQTPASTIFLSDLLEKMFPDSAAKYVQAINTALQQKQSAQAQQLQQMLAIAKKTIQGIVSLSKHPAWFSETGQIHAFPIVEYAAEQFEELIQNSQQQNQQLALPQPLPDVGQQ